MAAFYITKNVFYCIASNLEQCVTTPVVYKLPPCEQHLFSFLKKNTPWSESASELCRPSDRRLLAKLVPTFADRGSHVVSVMDPYGRILDFLDRFLS
jgi:hypothetical protein